MPEKKADGTEAPFEIPGTQPGMTVIPILLFVIYIILGVLLMACNGYFACVIAFRPILLKRYAVLLAQVIANAIAGIGIFIAGIARLILVNKAQNTLISRRQCLLTPWILIFTWVEPIEAATMLMISIDRLIAVTLPVTYRRIYSNIVFSEIAFWNCGMGILTVISWIYSWQSTDPEISPLCWTHQTQTYFFRNLWKILEVGCSVGSVVLYILVFLLTRKTVQRVRGIGNTAAANDAFEHRQRKLTATMGISCLVTFVFFVIPTCLGFFGFSKWNQTLAAPLAMYVGISCNLNPLAILVTVFLMQDDIHQAVLRSFQNVARKAGLLLQTEAQTIHAKESRSRSPKTQMKIFKESKSRSKTQHK